MRKSRKNKTEAFMGYLINRKHHMIPFCLTDMEIDSRVDLCIPYGIYLSLFQDGEIEVLKYILEETNASTKKIAKKIARKFRKKQPKFSEWIKSKEILGK